MAGDALDASHFHLRSYAEGVMADSRWLSAATPPICDRNLTIAPNGTAAATSERRIISLVRTADWRIDTGGVAALNHRLMAATPPA